MSLYDIVNGALDGLAGTVGARTESYIDIETVDTETVLALKDGSLLTVIEIDGVKGVIGTVEFDKIVDTLSETFGIMFGKPGKVFQFVIASDPEGALRDLARLQAGAAASAERIHLDVVDLLAERTKTLSKWVTRERVFLAVWTTPDAIPKHVRKTAQKTARKAVGKGRESRNSQHVLAPLHELRASHSGTIMNIMAALESETVGIAAWTLTAREALFEMRFMIDPAWTSDKWRAALPGDEGSLRLKTLDPGEAPVDSVFWPRVSAQIMPRGAERIDFKTARIGDTYYRPILMNLGPVDPKVFREFYLRAREVQLPFRLSIRMESGGMDLISTRRTFSQILASVSESNRLFLSAVDALQEHMTTTGEAIVQLKMCAVTWADDPVLLKKRASILSQLLSSWGDSEWSETTGSPIVGTLSSVIGVTKGDLAPASAWPISRIVKMLPLTRPSMPWRDGAQLLRSPDGKLLPFQPGSTLQTAWVNIGFAPMGGGKSVFLNTQNLALCLSPGIKRLPRISVLDVGWSSSGLVSLLKGALPPSQAHLVLYEKIQMAERYAINIFDTPLGSRVPLPFQRIFIKNFLSLLATPLGTNQPYDGVAGVIDLVIDMVYTQTADLDPNKGSPKKYERGIDFAVDAALDKIHKDSLADGYTTWWNVVDLLFDHNDTHHASLAQRYAVPTLNDILPLFNDEAVRSQFAVTLPTGETMAQYMQRAITSAIREYRIIGQPTRFDFGEARVIVLNLEDVAPDGGDTNPAANKQTGVFYLMGIYALTKDFTMSADLLPFFHEKYRNYHAGRIADTREDVKHLACDEYHRTRGYQAINDSITRIIREGRKWGVVVSLYSQMVQDFTDVVKGLATCTFIFGAGMNTTEVAQAFRLSPVVEKILTYGIRKPGAKGADMIGVFRTAKGVMTQHLTSTVGPMELWAFSTTKEDVNIRDKLYAQIGPVAARQRLARRFPGGSAASEVERRMAGMVGGNDIVAMEEAQKGILDTIVKELIEMNMEA